MTKPIERAIVTILLVLCMPFAAAWLTKLLFGDLLLALIAGGIFLYFGAWSFDQIYPKKK